jgi:hypothetical protein
VPRSDANFGIGALATRPVVASPPPIRSRHNLPLAAGCRPASPALGIPRKPDRTTGRLAIGSDQGNRRDAPERPSRFMRGSSCWSERCANRVVGADFRAASMACNASRKCGRTACPRSVSATRGYRSNKSRGAREIRLLADCKKIPDLIQRHGDMGRLPERSQDVVKRLRPVYRQHDGAESQSDK